MISEKVDISPPSSTRVDLTNTMMEDDLQDMVGQTFVQVSFHMTIGDLVDSEIMQLYPFDFAKLIYTRFRSTMEGAPGESQPAESEQNSIPAAKPEPVAAPMPQPGPMPAAQQQMDPQMASMQQQPMMGMQQPMNGAMPMYAMPTQNVPIQPAQFQSFAPSQDLSGIAPENIDLIMDVPLEVTVELGRTSKSIKEILDFSPGTIIELDKLAGEPVDVLVNGKQASEVFKPRQIRLDRDYLYYDYYVQYFNGQYGEICYDYHQDKEENLLILSDSYAWQIDYLIAASFNKTYVVNLRYDKWKKEDLNLEEYMLSLIHI